MVYCPKCGAKNEDDAKFCVKCGAPLYPEKQEKKREEHVCFGPREKHVEEECFGLPYGGAIAGIIIGAFIILFGLAMALGIEIGRLIAPIAIIIVGLLIIAGAIFRLRRK